MKIILTRQEVDTMIEDVIRTKYAALVAKGMRMNVSMPGMYSSSDIEISFTPIEEEEKEI